MREVEGERGMWEGGMGEGWGFIIRVSMRGTVDHKRARRS